ncbi:MAG: metal ABC transporter permease [Pseudomonadales bacterium]|nr:metal ABC transporter permease [Pseudomonadales bacterium]MBO6566449.1 metal ABC transporter permease [Pseudomonadales bacterium]MBO6594641.1 metal ABC transporter permease [Pseudomonadales bacterium]MBO6655430.1 metal ABC transporter permease [Pseudomonadales bacterium]MBO6821799.1 metal ABC transporter permease [Pseudomonadales bacterium]
MYSLLIDPFLEYGFMQRALVGSILLCMGSVPVGIFMTLRRMSLTGDAMAHAILPGAAVAYLLSGLSLVGLTIGGVVAGLIVAVLAGLVARATHLKEDASFATFYLISLAFGVLVISVKQSNVDLFHVLFGNILALDDSLLILLSSISSISTLLMAILYRPLVIECADPTFLVRLGYTSAIAHFGFLFLMVINLVAGFHALGTLMAIGVMVLPAVTARFWVKTLDAILVTSLLLGIFGCYAGLLMSFYFDLPSGPSIIMALGVVYGISLLLGTNGSWLQQLAWQRHLAG